MRSDNLKPDYFTRLEHGNLPVWVQSTGGQSGRARIVMGGSDSVSQEFPSARQFFLTLYNGRDQHQTMARYFRVSSHGLYIPSQPSIVDVLGSPVVYKKVKRAMGIDLQNRGHEVAKLLFSGFGARIMKSGFEPQEVLQEVYRGILARNYGTCAWDESKSSFSHYVHMVCSCVLNNYHKREYRHRGREIGGIDAGDMVVVDESTIGEDRIAVDDLASWISKRYGDILGGGNLETTCQVIPLLRVGMTRQEMSDCLGVEKRVVNKAIKVIREAAFSWKEELGI